MCILAVARMGIACVSLRRTSTDHSLPYCNSGLLQQYRPLPEDVPITGAKTPAVHEGILLLILKYMAWGAVDIQSIITSV